MKDYLPRLSAKGSGDDVSISAMIDFDRISDIDEVREFDKEKEKAKVEEIRKAEARKAEEERIRVELEHGINNKLEESKTKVTCQACGQVVDEGASHCSECGAKLEEQVTEVNESDPPKSPEPTSTYNDETIVIDETVSEDEPTEVVVTEAPVDETYVEQPIDATAKITTNDEVMVTTDKAEPEETVVVTDSDAENASQI